MPGDEPTKATLKQVQQALLKTLCTNANKLLDTKITVSDPATEDDLVKILKAVGEAKFKSQYGYDYKGKDSQPGDKASGATVTGTEALCSITNDTNNQIGDYVDAKLLSAANLSKWAQATARADLVVEGRRLYRSQTGNDWFSAAFQKTYDSPDTKENSIKTDAEFVYCNASLKIDDVTAAYTIIYYVGVYYDIISPTKVVSNSLIEELCKQANKLLDKAITLSTPPTVQDLGTILAAYGKKKFKDDFGFDFKGNDSIPSDKVAETSLYGVESLCYIRDHNPDTLGPYVDDKILKAMNLSTWVKTPARNDLLTEVKNCFNTNTGNNWFITALQKTYNSSDTKEIYSTQTRAKLVYCNGSLTKDNVTATYTFIHYVGVYYKVTSPSKAASEGLMKELCEQANKLLDKPIILSVPPTLQDLEKILPTYAKKKFKDDFSFDYNGNQSSPSDKVADTSVYGTEAIYFIQNGYATTLGDYIDDKILNAMHLPKWVQKSARAELLHKITVCLNTTTGNNWFIEKFQQSYNGPDTRDNSRKTDAKLVYCNGSLTKDGATATYSVIYYVGVYYEIANPQKAVAASLIKELCTQANKLLSSPITLSTPPTVEDLEKILTAYGKIKFKDAFGFEYKGTASQPSDKAANSRVAGTEALCFIQNKDSKVLGNYIDSEILSAMGLPSWVKKSARDDLVTQLTDHFKETTGNTWFSASFQQTYDHAAVTSGTKPDSIKTDAVFVYTNAELTEDDVTATMTFIHYVGIYYGVPAPKDDDGGF